TLFVVNSTLANNTARGGFGGLGGGGLGGAGGNGQGFGGALFNLNGSVTVVNSTLAFNAADGGGALYNLGDNGVATQDGPALPHTTALLTLNNSILSNSAGGVSDFVTATNASDGANPGVQLAGGNNNLVQTNPAVGGFTGAATVIGNPLLIAGGNNQPLANGGPTPT